MKNGSSGKVKKILIAVLCIAVIAGVCVMMLPTIEGLKYKNDELKSCDVSTGGGMLGGSRRVSLKRERDGGATLSVSRRETHADREVTTTYQVDPSALDHVRQMVSDYDLYAASKRRYSDMQALDADTTSLYFSFSEGSFRISEEQVLSRKMSKGFDEVEKYLASLAQGEGVTTIEPQTATLYLNSGYTLRFTVEDAFDGKLDDILSEEREVTPFENCGIILNTAEGLDTSAAEPIRTGAAGSIVYDNGRIIILYEDHDFEQPVYLLAFLDGYLSTACPLIAEMEGPYRLHLN